MPDLGSTLSLNASNFAAGIAQTRAKLVELNTALIENRQKMKEVSKEAAELQKQERELSNSMKDGGTKEQQQELQTLRDRIGQVNAELGSLRTREKEIQSDIRKTSNELEKQKGSTDDLTESTDKANDSLKKLETGLKAVLASAAGKKIFDFLIGTNAEMEQYLTSFEVMLGDMEKAKELMSDLNSMAAKTPMSLDNITAVGTQLLNYGVAADSLVSTMTQLGDLASGNAQKFERVSLAYGQMLAKGKVSGEELRQMTEAGVPLLQALADTLNVTAGEVQDLISKGKVGIPELNAAIESMTTGTGQFAGMMEKQAQTFEGMLSTLSDEAVQFGRDVGEGAFGVAKKSLSELLEMIDHWRDDGTLEEIARDAGTTVEVIANSIKTVITLLVDCRGAIIPLISAFVAYKAAVKGMSVIDGLRSSVSAFTSLIKAETVATEGATVAQEGLNVAMTANPIGLAIAAVAGLTAGIIYLSSQVENAEDRFNRLNGEIKDLRDNSKSVSEAVTEEQKKLSSVVTEYQKINDNVDDATEKKDKLIELQKVLNELYGEEKTQIDLVNGSYEENIRLLEAENEAAKQRAINQIQSDLEAAEKKQSDATTLQAIHIEFDADKITDEVNDWYNEIKDKISDDGFNLVELTGFGDKSTLTFSGNINQVIENLDNLEKAILASGKAGTDLKDMFDAVHDGKKQFEEMRSATEEIREEFEAVETGTNLLTESAGYAVDTFKELAGAFEAASPEDLTKQTEDLTKAASDLVNEYSSLYDSVNKIKEGEALNYEQIQALLKVYPTLSKYIEVTADGYSIEIGALDDLSNALDDNLQKRIEHEKQATYETLRGWEARKKIIEREIATSAQAAANDPMARAAYDAAMTKLKDADAEIATLYAKLDTWETTPAYLASNRGKSTKETKSSTSAKSDTQKAKDPAGLKTLMSYAKTATSAFKEMQENGELALSTVQALMDAGYGDALYQDAEGKWKLTDANGEFTKALNDQITAAQGVEGATDKEKAALETLRKSIIDITAGTYGLIQAEEKLSETTVGDMSSNMRTLSEAIAEQNTNGGLSADSVSSIAGTRYAKALTVVEGKITLDSSKLKAELSDEIDKAIEDLNEKLKTAEEGDIPGLKAQIQAFEDLKAVIDEVVSGLYGVEKAQEKVVSDDAMSAYEKAANRRLKMIDAELAAKRKLRDETLKAIDDEVQARKRLIEDNDIQKQIDQVSAQLKYSQLDEFSRAQLERKMQSLENDKADMLWERGVEDRRAAANEEYDTAAEQLNAEKEAINNALEALNKLNDTFIDGFGNLGEIIKEAMESVKPDSTVNINLNNADSLTAEQIIALVEQVYGSSDATQ